MDLSPLHQVSNWEWRLEPEGAMRVPAVLYGEREPDRGNGREGSRADQAMWPACRVSWTRPIRCRTRIGAMASQSAA